MFDITPMLNQPFGVIASVRNSYRDDRTGDVIFKKGEREKLDKSMNPTDKQLRDDAYQNGVLLFLGKQSWMTDKDWKYFQSTGGKAK